jgi:hypothetical protein
MNLTSSTGTWLNGSLQPQHYFVSLEVSDPDGKSVVRVNLTFEQAARMLLYNGDVECTLERYRDTTGKLVQEIVEKPETIHDRMKERMKETRDSLRKRIEDARRDVYDMVNGNIKGKAALKNLLQNIDTIKGHFVGNEDYVLAKAEEELAEMQENATGQIGLFLQSRGIDAPTDVLKQLLSTGAPLAITDKNIAPIVDNYELKDRPGKLISELTPMETADALGKILRKLAIQEIEQKKITPSTENTHLYCPGTSQHKDKVSIRYINYQSSHSLSLDEARDYLKFLVNIKDISEFKTHWHYKE